MLQSGLTLDMTFERWGDRGDLRCRRAVDSSSYSFTHVYIWSIWCVSNPQDSGPASLLYKVFCVDSLEKVSLQVVNPLPGNGHVT